MIIYSFPKRQSRYYKVRLEHGKRVMSRRLREGSVVRIKATGVIGLIEQIDVTSLGHLLTVCVPDVKRRAGGNYRHCRLYEVERIF